MCFKKALQNVNHNLPVHTNRKILTITWHLNNVCLGVFLDLLKALDTANHTLLFKKLEHWIARYNPTKNCFLLGEQETKSCTE